MNLSEQHLLEVKYLGRLWGQGCIWWTVGVVPNCCHECCHAALHILSLFVWRPPPLHGRLLSKCLVHPAQPEIHPKESWAAEHHVSFSTNTDTFLIKLQSRERWAAFQSDISVISFHLSFSSWPLALRWVFTQYIKYNTHCCCPQQTSWI